MLIINVKKHLNLYLFCILAFYLNNILIADLIPTNNKIITQNIVTNNYLVTNNVIVSSNHIIIYVKGMVCSFCAQGISKSFEKIPVINSININLENKTVELFLAPHTKISDQSIITVIKESGYNVERIER